MSELEITKKIVLNHIISNKDTLASSRTVNFANSSRPPGGVVIQANLKACASNENLETLTK